MSHEPSSRKTYPPTSGPTFQEALFVRYVSTLTGRTYDENTVDHLADMLLIFYAAGGTVLGALVGGVVSIPLLVPVTTPTRFALIVLPLVLFGALMGCGLVMAVLNLRGLVRWENYVVKRTATLKRAAYKAEQR